MMETNWLTSISVAALLSFAHIGAVAQMPDPPGQVAPGEAPVHEAYLFAHMTHADYGRLYYSVSTNGLHWRRLAGGRCVFPRYHGHADICHGHDGRYYLVGNRRDSSPDINFWTSDDLIHWTKYSVLAPDLQNVPDYPRPIAAIGAPKIFYDEPSQRYLVTWHTPHHMERDDLPEPYWASQRTLYVTSPDLKEFSSPPRRLFGNDLGEDLATIDTIVRRVDGQYWAIVKDERYPTLDWPTGKTIRIASSENLLGPYKNLSAPISPNFREAPTLIPSPNGRAWYLYYEQYPGVGYGLSVAQSLTGPWFQAAGNMHFSDWDKYELPRQVRHGSMIPISRKQYDRLREHFGTDGDEPAAAAQMVSGDE